tara:strand:- start:12381 stop:13535 length:1155 start_codon:yes stop_codon:yes gene_type:complete
VEKALIILNTNSYILSNFIKKQVAHVFETQIYIIDENLDKTTNEIIRHINDLILKENISTCFFQGCYISLINYDFIKQTNFKKKYFFLTDDFDAHEINSQTALACDGIMTVCPISQLKYNEKNLNASFYVVESDCELFKNHNLKKDIDILFFGAFKADRIKFLKDLENQNKKIKIIQAKDNYLPYNELVKYICRSKIVVNFSKTGPKKKFYSHRTYPFNYLQLKGKIFMAGFCGTLCLSEYSPSQKIIFGNHAPTFKNSDEMINEINKYLGDDKLLKDKTKNFADSCKPYIDKINFPKIFSELSNSNNKLFVKKLPYWYLRCFFIKSLRLIANKNSLKVLYKQFFENISNFIKYSGFTFPLLLVEAFFHLMYLQMKTIKNKFNK